jgi:Uma2 family endonuclease
LKRDLFEIPKVVPLPPGGWSDDDGKISEYIDGRWIPKPDIGRLDTSMTIGAILKSLSPLSETVGGEILSGWHMLAVPDLLRPDVVMSFPRYSIYDGYLVAPAFLTVEVRVDKEQISSLVRKCRERYHPFGTPFCWIIDIASREGYECHRDSDEPVTRRTLTAGAQVSLSVEQIFSEVKRL